MSGGTHVSELQHSRWHANGGLEVEHWLSDAVALVDAKWLCAEAQRDGAVLRHRQELPADAFIAVDALKAATIADTLPIIVVSAAWLHPSHPDPLGDNLCVITSALRHYVEGAINQWGVAWDWLSLHQHPDEANGELRSAEEERLYREGLLAVGVLAAHPSVTVFELTTMPPRYPLGYQLPPSTPPAASHHRRCWLIAAV